MGKQTQLVNEIIIALGGAENVHSITHCVTRLRIVLHDESQVNQTRINELTVVKGSQFQSGQFQIIIGPGVQEVYAAIVLHDTQAPKAVAQAPQPTKRWYQRLIQTLAEILIPILPVVIAGGLVIGLQTVLTEIEFNGMSLLIAVPNLAIFSEVLTLLSQAIFMFLPVLVAFVTSKRFGGSPLLGIVVGLTLVLSQTVATTSDVWNFGFLTIPGLTYSGQVLPAIAAGLIIAKTEVFLTRKIPDLFKVLLVPVFSLLFTLIVVFLIIGPIAQVLGFGLGEFLRVLFGGPWRFLTGMLFGFAYAPLTLTGFHHLFLLADLQLIAMGGTMIWPMIALSNIAQGSAALAMYVKYRQKTKRQQAGEATQAALVGGVTEPAMFGINLPIKSAFYAALIGSGIASGCSVVLQIQANAIGIGGLPAILSIPVAMWSRYLGVIALAIIIPFGLTLIFEARKKENKTGE